MAKTLNTALAAGLAVATLGTAVHAQDKSIIYVTPNPIGNNPFLVLGQEGAEAAGEARGAEVITYESDAPQAMLENLYAAASVGADIVVAMSFSAVDGVMEVAPTAPDTQFLLVDACTDQERPDNVHCAVFREHESSFLMGAIAAMTTETGTVGVIGPIDIPFMHRFTDGFAAGVAHVDPEVTVETRWVGGQNPFSDPVRAKEQALALDAAGADVIYAAAAGGSFGVYEAAAESGFVTMGVDTNLCGVAPGTMYDVALKRVDQAVLQSIEAIEAGEAATFASYGLAEGGMSAMAVEGGDALAESGCLIADDAEVAAEIRSLAEQIVAGEVVVDDPMMAN
ncbi:putative lipoprotein [Oceanicola granulosus HTCC2516]|uniref:Putative lipoprotein n=1 Tax=Oceanicola granulosus (strain ATCC BAA-861 / DSM 15982 / KCTC 12143 / HTCC2516) TaxID=314256 RepID=Q2CJ92_OCEGH|nr:BMP family ABC transporter substrate-binding protein [Oceanicola granulosus]EAR52708.1 putative lipoprotein [Oceanicola granulosus HTCC2516]